MESQDAKDFEPFLVVRVQRLAPQSSCSTKSEMERALGQRKKLNSHISKALQGDFDSKIQVKRVDALRAKLEHEIDALERQLEALEDMSRAKKRMRRQRHGSDESLCPVCGQLAYDDPELGLPVCLACGGEPIVKEAGTPHFTGIQVQISAFENAVTGMLINAVVSGGKNMEELYGKLKKKYGFSEREELAILQILADKGYPVFKDRAMLGDDEDPSRKQGDKTLGEWQSQYLA